MLYFIDGTTDHYGITIRIISIGQLTTYERVKVSTLLVQNKWNFLIKVFLRSTSNCLHLVRFYGIRSSRNLSVIKSATTCSNLRDNCYHTVQIQKRDITVNIITIMANRSLTLGLKATFNRIFRQSNFPRKDVSDTMSEKSESIFKRKDVNFINERFFDCKRIVWLISIKFAKRRE